MKEFMLLIRNRGDHQKEWSAEEHQQFLRECEEYIGNLKAQGKLIAAQPLVREGIVISRSAGGWKEQPLRTSEDLQVGYYHILATDMEDAIAIARKNPEFAHGTTASIEVRPVKVKEETTGFEYPNA